jgi:hypothetical protein
MKLRLFLLPLLLVSSLGLSACGSSTPSSFTASIDDVAVLEGNYVRVWFSVVNDGDSVGYPKCTISIDALSAYGDPMGYGFDSLSGSDAVAPGETFSRYMDIVVTNNAAHYVTDASTTTIDKC